MNPDLLTEIETGPTGPKVGALFDFDGTLIDGYSVRAFAQDTIRHFQLPPLAVGPLISGIAAATAQGGDMATFVAGVAQALKGREEEELAALGGALFRRSIAGMSRPEARALVRAHQRQGHTVVIATSATAYQVEPFAADLGIEHVLCTRLETSDGRLTGRLAGPVLWGEEKAAAVRSFADAHGIDLDESWAYADGDEDLPFLAAVGRPRPMSPHRGLAAAATNRAWPVDRWERRPRIDLVALARSGAAAAGLGAGAGLALAAGVLNRSRRDAANVAFSAGSDLALALGGIRLRVTGAEHLWSHRPAVFIFNHQSALDVLVIGNLLRRDVSGVAKREAAHDPRFAVFGALGGIAYIDRADHAQALSTLHGVVERIRAGTSIAIAPEGTRSPTDTLGRFKKGAFRLAMEAGVPIVPIVIRNTGELMWRGAALLRPGIVDVAVFPPIDPSSWTPEDLAPHVAEVRRLFANTLADWPANGGNELNLQPIP